jgi:hypothetical protein
MLAFLLWMKPPENPHLFLNNEKSASKIAIPETP